eukprot:TRINITY_DN8100_c0_g2_i1.p1 TRINITY_DN8100_c0_g2~~TRINITY_DN8100_c0_g2_i1.p1  ORF type:complete len:192 (-),score=14.77 TRINITY_DN8100_c0_g2_i1:19-594(-)
MQPNWQASRQRTAGNAPPASLVSERRVTGQDLIASVIEICKNLLDDLHVIANMVKQTPEQISKNAMLYELTTKMGKTAVGLLSLIKNHIEPLQIQAKGLESVVVILIKNFSEAIVGKVNCNDPIWIENFKMYHLNVINSIRKVGLSLDFNYLTFFFKISFLQQQNHGKRHNKSNFLLQHLKCQSPKLHESY